MLSVGKELINCTIISEDATVRCSCVGTQRRKAAKPYYCSVHGH